MILLLWSKLKFCLLDLALISFCKPSANLVEPSSSSLLGTPCSWPTPQVCVSQTTLILRCLFGSHAHLATGGCVTPLWSPPSQDLIATIVFRFSNSVTTQPTVKSSLQGRGITRPFKNVGLSTQHYFSVVSQNYACWILPASRMLCGKRSLAL